MYFLIRIRIYIYIYILIEPIFLGVKFMVEVGHIFMNENSFLLDQIHL